MSDGEPDQIRAFQESGNRRIDDYLLEEVIWSIKQKVLQTVQSQHHKLRRPSLLASLRKKTMPDVCECLEKRAHSFIRNEYLEFFSEEPGTFILSFLFLLVSGESARIPSCFILKFSAATPEEFLETFDLLYQDCEPCISMSSKNHIKTALRFCKEILYFYHDDLMLQVFFYPFFKTKAQNMTQDDLGYLLRDIANLCERPLFYLISDMHDFLHNFN